MTLAVVDASNLLWRCAHGAGWRADSAASALVDDPIGGPRLLRDMAREAAQTAVLHAATLVADRGVTRTLFAWEGPTNWRRIIFPDYKANRKKADDVVVATELFSNEAFRAFKAALTVVGVGHVTPVDGEADDAIAAVCRRGTDILVVSGDHDLLQLVRPGVAMMLLGKETEVVDDDDGVIRHIGVPAKLVPDYKAIAGDRSDGVPGVAGLGDVAALAILAAYPGVAAAVAAARTHGTAESSWIGTANHARKLVAGAEDARRYRLVCMLRSNVELVTDAPPEKAPLAGIAMRSFSSLSMPFLARPNRLREVRRAFGVS